MASETWVLNETLDISTLDADFTVNFVSNDVCYSAINGQGSGLDYNSTNVYYDDGPGGFVWVDNAYRTITFSTAPSGDLLTWLQVNGTKQFPPKVTVDLTSLSGYESLPAGTYALAVKSKAANYQDSDLSATVTFTKLAAPVATAADTTVTWDAITNAESYDVYVDGELYENTTGDRVSFKYL